MSTFSKLQSRHEDLINIEDSTEKLEQVRNYIREVKSGSSKVHNPQERDQLRANLRYWANYVYEVDEEYPNIELAPSTSSHNPQIILGIGSFIIIIIIVFVVLWLGFPKLQALIGAPTPIVTLTKPTFPPTLNIMLSPDTTDVQHGEEIAILLSFDPPIGIVEAKWEIVVGSGTIAPPEGDAVVFTAPEQDKGPVIIIVSGKTVNNTVFKKNITFNIISPPTPTSLPDCEFGSLILPPPSLNHSDLVGTFTTPARCTNDIKVGTAVTVSGTASEIPEGVFLWLFVFPRNARYYPQCEDASNGLCDANYDGEVWGNTVYLGDPVGYPNCKERFYLILASVDTTGNDFLVNEMIKQSRTGYTGFAFSELPRSTEELARLEIETAGSTNSCP